MAILSFKNLFFRENLPQTLISPAYPSRYRFLFGQKGPLIKYRQYVRVDTIRNSEALFLKNKTWQQGLKNRVQKKF
jgi:hypothetical protein